MNPHEAMHRMAKIAALVRRIDHYMGPLSAEESGRLALLLDGWPQSLRNELADSCEPKVNPPSDLTWAGVRGVYEVRAKMGNRVSL